MKARFSIAAPARKRRERFEQILREQGHTRAEIRALLPQYEGMSDSELDVRVRETYLRTVNECGVCSFAGDPRSVLMWSHYASNHQGVCFVFDVSRDPKTFVRALPIAYIDEHPTVNWVTDFKKGGVIKSIVLRKHNRWTYEKERRIIELESARQHLRFHPEALRALIIGCRMAEEDIKAVTRLLSERAIRLLPKLHLYRCEMHESENKLIIRTLKRW